MLRFLVGLLAFGMASIAVACNIPVFRYALERWKADPCRIILFSDGALAPEHLQRIDAIRKELEGTKANVEIVPTDLQRDMSQELKTLWDSLKSKTKGKEPYVVVQSTVGQGKSIFHSHGAFREFNVKRLIDSPVRRELIRRLTKGDSVVWLLVRSKESDRNQAIRTMLKERLEELSRILSLPEGIGLPGSELYAEVPLLLRFSLLEVDPSDPEESFLVQLIQGFDIESVEQGEPLLVPVFGRGRALEVLPASRLDRGLVGDLTQFLCGACSCQVKERNPGFDLLLAADWDKELFGEDGVVPTQVEPRFPEEKRIPKMIPIPPGKKKR